MDIWTKKGYTISYLGISCCCFHPKSHISVNALLNLHTLSHPHTGEIISQKFAECLAEWHFEPRKVLRIITDNGSNMIRAVKVLNEALVTEQEEQKDGEGCGDLVS
jgi:hypothetical protein